MCNKSVCIMFPPPMIRKDPVHFSGEEITSVEDEWKKYSNYLILTQLWEENRLKRKFPRDEDL